MSAPLAPLDARSTRRVIGLMTAGAFASSAAMRVCDPMLPRLAEEFSVGLPVVANVGTAFAATYGLLQLLIGPLGDRFGKFRVIRLAIALAALASLACALAPDLGWLIAGRALAGGVGGAIIPVAFAWIGDEIDYDERQHVLARVMSGGLLGVMSGQLVGGVFVDTVGWRWAFVALAAAFAVVAVRMKVDTRAGATPGAAATPSDAGAYGESAGASATGAASTALGPVSLLKAYAVIARPTWARVVLASVMLEALLMYGAVSFIPTALHDRFGLPLWQAGMISAVVGIGGYAYTMLARRLIGLLGERRLATLGGAMVALGVLGLAFAPAPWAAGVASLVLGLGFYAFHNTLQVHGTQLSATQRGMGVALFALSLFIGQSLGVTLMSLLVSQTGFRTAFVLAALSFALLTLFFVSRLARLQSGRNSA
jgi:MFS family permease